LASWAEVAVDWVIDRVRDWGYGGIFIMMTVESSFVPFPSEVALIPAGYLASRGEMDPVVATGAGVLGSLVGAVINYVLALWLGRPFVERLLSWIPGGQGQLVKSDRFFHRHGEVTIFVGRLLPGIRQLISLPAGLARMNVPRFLLYTALGSGLWSSILVAIGWWAGAEEELWRPLLRQATLWLVAGVMVLVVAYIYLHRRAGRAA
jgi:membrane protein DedA with SNARE-associated domain